MKKLLALLLTIVMSVTLFAGCSDPVYDDFSNYLNVEMAEVNADYTKITEEVGRWEAMEDDNAIAKSLSEVLIPLVDGSLSKLQNVNPQTDEVKAIKAKYVEVMEAYKTGFETLLEGCNTQDEATINAANEALSKGLALLDEYNAALEALATEVGGEIEY